MVSWWWKPMILFTTTPTFTQTQDVVENLSHIVINTAPADGLELSYRCWRTMCIIHCTDVIMSAMASQITSVSIFCLKVCSGADQRKHQSSASLGPVPLTIFRSNSKFDQNLQCSSLKFILPSSTRFCTRHDSYTVVTCAKFHCDLLNVFQTRAFLILIEFWIRSKWR